MDRPSNVQCVTGPEAINMGAQWILIRVYFNRGGTIKKVGRQGLDRGRAHDLRRKGGGTGSTRPVVHTGFHYLSSPYNNGSFN